MEVSESSPSPSITSTEPTFDHQHQQQQSSNSITDQLDALSLHPPKLDAGNNGDRVGSGSEEGENEENYQKEINEVTNLIENEFEEVGEGEGEREKNRITRFPVRHEAEDCTFYLRTGMCKFGMNCKFNHPPDRKPQGGKMRGKEEALDNATQKVKEMDDSKAEQIDCKYFDRPGGCKYGKSCKFSHSRKTSSTVELNFMGLPIRPGEKECPYYMRTGSCKFGANCKFNHPDPTSIGGSDNRSGNSNGGSILSPNASKSTLGSWSPAALTETPPYIPLMFPPTQGVPSQPEWHAYQAPVYPPERSMQLASAYAPNSKPPERNAYAHKQQRTPVDEFPERPGQPECSFFLKTGTCKFRSACKFDHPKNEGAKSTPCALSDLGLPLRPGQSICSYYSRYGICKFGPACKYDHPINHAHPDPVDRAVDESSASGDSVENDQTIASATEISNENLIQQSA